MEGGKISFASAIQVIKGIDDRGTLTNDRRISDIETDVSEINYGLSTNIDESVGYKNALRLAERAISFAARMKQNSNE
jgi:hypothetical protein